MNQLSPSCRICAPILSTPSYLCIVYVVKKLSSSYLCSKYSKVRTHSHLLQLMALLLLLLLLVGGLVYCYEAFRHTAMSPSRILL
jgi:hypothetical protein